MSKRYWVALGFGAVLFFVGAISWRVKQVARRSALAAAADSSIPVATSRVATSLDVAETAYDGGMGAGWEDWGWGPHEIAKVGPAKVEFAGYGGIILHHAELHAAFGGVALRYKPPGAWPEFLAVQLKHAGTADSVLPQVAIEPRHVATLADGWREALVDWAELNPSNVPFDSVMVIARSAVATGWVLLDKIVLTKAGPRKAGQAPARDVELAVRCDASPHPISPLIYGGSGGDLASGESAQRIGGNPLTRLNWDEGDLWNSGNDWFFENSKFDGSLWNWIDGGVRDKLPTALVVPMIGWVAKDATSVGFPKAKFGKQRKYDQYREQAGDGFRPDGSKIPPGPPTETSVAAPPEVIGRWIRMLREKDRERGARGVQMYILDNEPSLWNVTHRDVHPDAVSYDELLDRSRRYATEIRNADPDAVIAGPAEWGWRGYFFSGLDQSSDSAHPDQHAHGDEPLVAWYLRQLAEHEKKTGVRLLDVFDVHFYPAADGIYGSNARVDAAAAELRVRSTRALWDPTYKDESWIKEPIALIPRLKRWVAANYPGRKISLGEWSFGADADISGGLATAEALGRFGQQGLDSAFYWAGPKAGTATFWAFRAFRNFDGAGGRFLDNSLATTDDENVSLFASADDAGTHIVAVIVNRDRTFAVNARVDLGPCRTLNSRRVFSYGPGSTALTEQLSEKADLASPVVIQPSSFAVLDLRVQRQ
jgi:hypothetical protein